MPIKDSIEDLASKGTKVVNSWPITGHGTHLIIDDKGLKAVTAWDEERGYRRIVYNRDGVVYVETTAPDRVKINGEIIELVEGSNYIEVEELTNDTTFLSYEVEGEPIIGHNTIAIIIRCLLPDDICTSNYGTWFVAYDCTALKNLEISITSNVNHLGGLLYWDWYLEHINCGAWDTSGVKQMQNIFAVCSGLKEVHCENWNTSNATNMGRLFVQCDSLEYLDVSNWDVSKVTSFSNTFCRVGSRMNISNPSKTFPTIDVSKWNTISATNMESMFESILDGTQLIGVENLIVDKVTKMNWMFSNTWCLEELDLSSWNPVKLVNTNSMFFNWGNHKNKLKRLNISSFDPTNWTDITNMFFNCQNIIHLDFPQMGKIKKTGVVFDFSYIWKLDDESIRGLFEYDRASAGLSSLSVKLPSRANSILSTEEKAEISAKGYTLSYMNSLG